MWRSWLESDAIHWDGKRNRLESKNSVLDVYGVPPSQLHCMYYNVKYIALEAVVSGCMYDSGGEGELETEILELPTCGRSVEL